MFNLKTLNQHMKYQRFKMDNIKDVMHMLRPGDYMAKLDRKDAHFSIPMAPSSQKFMRFKWRNKLYQILVIRSGSGARIFTKIMKPIVAFLRQKGQRVAIFLGSLFLLIQDIDQLIRDMNSLIFLLKSLVFTINWDKQTLCPHK